MELRAGTVNAWHLLLTAVACHVWLTAESWPLIAGGWCAE
jgi:hypothetical protein